MINIHLSLNERLSKFGGHIGYGIRVKEYYEDMYFNGTVVDYSINVKKSLETYKNIYEQYTKVLKKK